MGRYYIIIIEGLSEALLKYFRSILFMYTKEDYDRVTSIDLHIKTEIPEEFFLISVICKV